MCVFRAHVLVCVVEDSEENNSYNNYTHLNFRLLILAYLEISKTKTTTFPKEERFQSSGQLQRPFTIASTPLPVMSGAMAASSMRYGHWDTSHLVHSPMLR